MLNAGLAERCRARGLRTAGEHQAYLIEGGLELSADALQSARNFYVCGRKIKSDARPMAITLCVNDIQRKTIPLTENSINAGIIDPVLLAGVANVFRVEIDYLDPETKLPAGEASKAVVITHVVIDDQVVDRL
jgi:hypothetical protein